MNTLVIFAYYGFMHSSLYFWGLGERPFHPNRIYRISKVFHNMWYTFLGVFQYTIWEAIFMYCWATKRLPFMSDSEAFSNVWNLSKLSTVLYDILHCIKDSLFYKISSSSLTLSVHFSR